MSVADFSGIDVLLVRTAQQILIVNLPERKRVRV